MVALFCYDVSTLDRRGRRRLRHVAKLLERYGTRVQKSVFEVRTGPRSVDYIQESLLEIMDLQEDSLRVYRLPDGIAEDVVQVGVQQGTEFFGQTLIF